MFKLTNDKLRPAKWQGPEPEKRRQLKLLPLHGLGSAEGMNTNGTNHCDRLLVTDAKRNVCAAVLLRVIRDSIIRSQQTTRCMTGPCRCPPQGSQRDHD